MKTRTPLHKNLSSAAFLKCKAILTKLPFLYLPARFVKRVALFCIWRIRVFGRKKKNTFAFDAVYQVDPAKIIFCTEKEFDPIRYDGICLDGNWDMTRKKFTDLDVFKGFQEHFVNNVPWEETAFYRSAVGAITYRQEYLWDCLNPAEFRLRCQKLDTLFQTIRQNGYKDQKQLGSEIFSLGPLNEISVNLGRTGDLLFNDGAHRLAIAKILHLKKVPVRVTVTHKQCPRTITLETRYA